MSYAVAAEPLWRPDAERIAAANITTFSRDAAALLGALLPITRAACLVRGARRVLLSLWDYGRSSVSAARVLGRVVACRARAGSRTQAAELCRNLLHPAGTTPMRWCSGVRIGSRTASPRRPGSTSRYTSRRRCARWGWKGDRVAAWCPTCRRPSS